MIIDLVLFAPFLGCGIGYVVTSSLNLKKYYTNKEKILYLTVSVASLIGFILSLTLLVGEPTLTITRLEHSREYQYKIRSMYVETGPNIVIIKKYKSYPHTILRDKATYQTIYLGKVTKEWNSEPKT